MSLENPRFFLVFIFQSLSTHSCFNFSSIKHVAKFHVLAPKKHTSRTIIQLLFQYQKVRYQREHGIYICFSCFTKDLKIPKIKIKFYLILISNQFMVYADSEP